MLIVFLNDSLTEIGKADVKMRLKENQNAHTDTPFWEITA
jgi:hypothetical protein